MRIKYPVLFEYASYVRVKYSMTNWILIRMGTGKKRHTNGIIAALPDTRTGTGKLSLNKELNTVELHLRQNHLFALNHSFKVSRDIFSPHEEPHQNAPSICSCPLPSVKASTSASQQVCWLLHLDFLPPRRHCHAALWAPVSLNV